MKESMWGYFILSLGILILAVMLLIQNMTTTNEEDFYLGREILEASMLDAVDYGTYRSTGELVMSKEKFVEVFIRRFADSVSGDKTYTLEFYDIHEYPPKATVRILTNTGTTEIKDSDFDVDINTFLNGVLETNGAYGAANYTVDPSYEEEEP